MTRVAATNPHAWFPEARTAEEITTVGPENRMVCFPYPKLMNSIIETDQAAAVIVTGSETAHELGIPEERWVYLWGCGDAKDKWFVSERVNYHSSPAIKAVTQRALGMSGLTVNDIGAFDLYSCFPSAVQLGLDALGLKPDDPRPITVTGGLPYAGGPGNNYVGHSIAAMVERLRERRHDYGLVTGNGWFVTKHSAGLYSARRPAKPWKRTEPEIDQAHVDAQESPPLVEAAGGRGGGGDVHRGVRPRRGAGAGDRDREAGRRWLGRAVPREHRAGREPPVVDDAGGVRGAARAGASRRGDGEERVHAGVVGILLDGSTNIADTVSFEDVDHDGFREFFEDENLDNLYDGVTKYLSR